MRTANNFIMPLGATYLIEPWSANVLRISLCKKVGSEIDFANDEVVATINTSAANGIGFVRAWNDPTAIIVQTSYELNNQYYAINHTLGDDPVDNYYVKGTIALGIETPILVLKY